MLWPVEMTWRVQDLQRQGRREPRRGERGAHEVYGGGGNGETLHLAQ
jgi:hypothetical protein